MAWYNITSTKTKGLTMDSNNAITTEMIMQVPSTELSNLCKMILWYLQDKQGAEVSLSTIANALGTIRQSVTPLLGQLEVGGYIAVDRSKRSGNIYFFTDKLTTGAKHEGIFE